MTLHAACQDNIQVYGWEVTARNKIETDSGVGWQGRRLLSMHCTAGAIITWEQLPHTMLKYITTCILLFGILKG